MNLKLKFFLVILVSHTIGFSQQNQDAAILKILLSNYYKNQKVIVKNRLQYLTLYCNKAPNNEETLEVIEKNDLLKLHKSTIKTQINNQLNEDWSKELIEVFTNQNQYLKSKVNNCSSVEEYQKGAIKHGENNQRLMIVSKPIYFGKKYCLVKVAFYRTIEHNNGCFILIENTNNVWNIKEFLNEWAT